MKAYPAKTLPSEAVEAYIASVPEPVRTTLRHLREIIRSAVPAEATEIISYGLPAFSLSKPFFGYAAFKGHLSVLPFSGSLLDSFAEELKPYSRSKGSRPESEKVVSALSKGLAIDFGCTFTPRQMRPLGFIELE